jgi:predicted  nucleic acid-binding Zn-ribbon protein
MFSAEEFDSLERKKQELRQRAQAHRDHLSELAFDILKTQKSLVGVENQIESLAQQQSNMIQRELTALEELDDANQGVQPSSTGESLVAFDDVQLEDFFSAGTTLDGPSLSGVAPLLTGSFLVPMSFPTRHILTI